MTRAFGSGYVFTRRREHEEVARDPPKTVQNAFRLIREMQRPPTPTRILSKLQKLPEHANRLISPFKKEIMGRLSRMLGRTLHP